MTSRTAPLFCLFVCLGAAHALAEGSDQVGTSQPLQSTTTVRADILDATTERICWDGAGSIDVFDPLSTLVGTVTSSHCIAPTSDATGAYALTLSDDQSAGNRWDFSVCDSSGDGTCDLPGDAIPGRISSTLWTFRTGSFSQGAALNGSFFALLPGGSEVNDTVVELRFDGLSGNLFSVGVNATGVDGPNAGRSVAVAGNSFTPRFPLYLSLPDKARYNPLVPTVTNFRYAGGPTGCNHVSPGATTGRFEFDSNVEGTYHLICDLDLDGQFNITDPKDLLIIGAAVLGPNTAEWNGLNNDGAPVPAGTYDCRVSLNVGEFHYVGEDMETSFEGFRMFEVASNGLRTPLYMHWNDTAVQGSAVAMDNGDTSPATSPYGGLHSGDPSDDASPQGVSWAGNARAWGDFSGDGKGDQTYLDTFTITRFDVTTSLQVVSVDATADTDGEGLPDIIEACFLGTDPEDADSDQDGIPDDVETNGGSPIDTDHDGVIDALDDDSDNDGIPDLAEGGGDTDGDGIPDFRDLDSDNDGIPDASDLYPGDPMACGDSDGDTCDDCSRGTDGFGAAPDADPSNDGTDTDGDGLCDAGDPDDDNDGVPDVSDPAPLDPTVCGDSDGDTCDDCSRGTDGFGPLSDNDPTNDGTDTDGDGLCDLGDPDDPVIPPDFSFYGGGGCDCRTGGGRPPLDWGLGLLLVGLFLGIGRRRTHRRTYRRPDR